MPADCSVVQAARCVHAPAPKYEIRDTSSVQQVQEQELAAARQETEALQQQLADQRSSLSQLLKEAQAENSGLRIALAKAQASFGTHQQAAEQAERSLQDAQNTHDLKPVQVGCRVGACESPCLREDCRSRHADLCPLHVAAHTQAWKPLREATKQS